MSSDHQFHEDSGNLLDQNYAKTVRAMSCDFYLRGSHENKQSVGYKTRLKSTCNHVKRWKYTNSNETLPSKDGNEAITRRFVRFDLSSTESAIMNQFEILTAKSWLLAGL